MKKNIGLVLMVAGMVSLAACGSESNKNEVGSAADQAEVVIGLDDTFVPMGFRDKDGELTGFDIELSQAIFDLTDTKVKYPPIDWARNEAELDSGTIDKNWNGYTKTTESEDKVFFSNK